jgi:hypothetical protein
VRISVVNPDSRLTTEGMRDFLLRCHLRGLPLLIGYLLSKPVSKLSVKCKFVALLIRSCDYSSPQSSCELDSAMLCALNRR